MATTSELINNPMGAGIHDIILDCVRKSITAKSAEEMGHAIDDASANIVEMVWRLRKANII